MIERAAESAGIWWEGFAGAALQAFVLVIGGLWGFVLYHRRREGQASIQIGVAAALSGGGKARRLLVRTHILNPSSVLVRNFDATVVLMEVRQAAPGQEFHTILLREADPLLPINGDMSDPDEDGRVSFSYPPNTDASLEPGECLECSVVFPLPAVDTTVHELWALRLTVTGQQRRGPFATPYEWGTFALVDPSLMTKNGFSPLTAHVEVGQ